MINLVRLAFATIVVGSLILLGGGDSKNSPDKIAFQDTVVESELVGDLGFEAAQEINQEEELIISPDITPEVVIDSVVDVGQAEESVQETITEAPPVLEEHAHEEIVSDIQLFLTPLQIANAIAADSNLVNEGTLATSLLDGATDQSGEVAVKIADVVIEGKQEGDELTLEEALAALLRITTTEEDLEKLVLAHVSNESSAVIQVIGSDGETHDKLAASLEDIPEVEEKIEALLTEETKEALIELIAKAAADGGVVTDTDIESAVSEVLQQKTAEKNELTAVLESEVQGITIEEILAQDAIATSTVPVLQVTAIAANGQQISIPLEFIHFEAGSVVLVIEPIRTFTPGLYTLVIKITNPITGVTEILMQDFAWGVLAMNTDKDVYKVGQTGEIHIGVLDDQGKPVCDAGVSLQITTPSGSIENPAVENTGNCKILEAGFIEPDYQTNYTFAQAGEYTLSLTATIPSGTRRMTSKINVTQTPSYIIKRTSATRLYPSAPAPMTIEVEFFQNFSGTITDIVPSGFELSGITPAASVAISESGAAKTLTWSGSWNAGEKATFIYMYDAPDVSPEFYTVGPLQLSPSTALGANSLLTEQRVWQIANDNPITVDDTNLKFWLRADRQVYSDAGSTLATDGATVQQWNDQTVGANNATQANTTNKPTFRAGTSTKAINFHPVIDFDGFDNYLDTGSFIPQSGQGAFSYYAITTGTPGAANWNIIFGYGVQLAGQEYGLAWRAGVTDFLGLDTGGSGNLVSTYATTATPTLIRHTYDGTNETLYANGTSVGTQAFTYNTATTNGLDIGRDIAPSNYVKGTIAELVLYNAAQSAADIIKLESYLAAKYGITLSTNYVNSAGTVVFNLTEAAGAYNNDIAAIAKDNAQILVNTKAKSSNTDAMVTIEVESTNLLDDKEFMFWGNNDGALTISTSDMPTAGLPAIVNNARVAREWRVQKTADMGTYKVTFDLDDINISPSDVTSFRLVVDDDGNFTAGTQSVFPASGEPTLNTATNQVTFTGVTLADTNFFALILPDKAPGGVSGDLTFWLKADTGTLNSGARITSGTVDQWEDQSGNTAVPDLNASAGTPTITADGLNFNPVIALNSTSHLNRASITASELFGTQNNTFYIVKRHNGGGIIDAAFDTVARAAYFEYASGFQRVNFGSQATTGSTTNIDGQFFITGYRTNATNIDLRINGFAEATGIATTISSTEVDRLTIGADSNLANNADVDVAEFIIYSGDKSADQNKIESYLALKYGITLNTGSVPDYIASDGTTQMWDTNVTGAAGYHDNVAGVGRDDASGLLQTTSKSQATNSVVTMIVENTSNIGNLEFLTWANNDASLTTQTTEMPSTGLPAFTTSRLTREWQVQENSSGGVGAGDIGTVTIKVDLSVFGVGVDSANGIRLLIDGQDENGDFSTGIVTVLPASGEPTLEADGVTVTFTGVDLDHEDYFTLALPTQAPGGVGSDIKLWLKADSGTYSNVTGTTLATTGQDVFMWKDASGKGNHVSEVTGKGEPMLVENALNYNPALQFCDTADTNSVFSPACGADLDTLSDSTGLFEGSTYTNSSYYFVAFQEAQGTDADRVFGETVSGTGGEYSHILWWSGDGNTYSRLGNNNTTLNGIAQNYINVMGGQDHTYNIWSAVGSTTNDGDGTIGQLIRKDGTQKFDDETFASFTGSNSAFYIGASQNNTEQFGGRIAEMIVYAGTTPQSELQQQQIESYLALKYGITLSRDHDADGTDTEVISGSVNEGDYLLSDGTTIVWDSTTDGAHHYNVMGIGRDDGSELDQRIAKSRNDDALMAVALDNNFTAANNDAARTTTWSADKIWLMYGHNSGSRYFDTSVSTANTNVRMGRVWKAHVTGTAPSVNFQFTNPNVAKFVTGQQYVLLRSTSANFASPIEKATATAANNGVIFTNVTPVNGYYYSVGTKATAPGGIVAGTFNGLRAEVYINNTFNDSFDSQSSWGDSVEELSEFGSGGVFSSPILTVYVDHIQESTLGGVTNGQWEDNYGVEYNGFLNVPSTQTDYLFYFDGPDDSAELYLDTNGDGVMEKILSVDFPTASVTSTAQSLTTGLVPFRVKFREGGGDAVLKVSWSSSAAGIVKIELDQDNFLTPAPLGIWYKADAGVFDDYWTTKADPAVDGDAVNTWENQSLVPNNDLVPAITFVDGTGPTYDIGTNVDAINFNPVIDVGNGNRLSIFDNADNGSLDLLDYFGYPNGLSYIGGQNTNFVVAEDSEVSGSEMFFSYGYDNGASVTVADTLLYTRVINTGALGFAAANTGTTTADGVISANIPFNASSTSTSIVTPPTSPVSCTRHSRASLSKPAGAFVEDHGVTAPLLFPHARNSRSTTFAPAASIVTMLSAFTDFDFN